MEDGDGSGHEPTTSTSGARRLQRNVGPTDDPTSSPEAVEAPKRLDSTAAKRAPRDIRVHTPKPKLEVPSTTQLGVSGPRMVVRGFFGRCPVCGSGRLFKRWVTMVDRCPECSFLFERLEGHWIGAIAVNTIAVIGLMMLLMLGTMVFTYPDLIPWQLIPVLILVGAAGPFVFYPASKTIWTAVDIMMRPLKWGEVDPRYVVVDPLRDNGDDSIWVNRSNGSPA